MASVEVMTRIHLMVRSQIPGNQMVYFEAQSSTAFE